MSGGGGSTHSKAQTETILSINLTRSCVYTRPQTRVRARTHTHTHTPTHISPLDSVAACGFGYMMPQLIELLEVHGHKLRPRKGAPACATGRVHVLWMAHGSELSRARTHTHAHTHTHTHARTHTHHTPQTTNHKPQTTNHNTQGPKPTVRRPAKLRTLAEAW